MKFRDIFLYFVERRKDVTSNLASFTLMEISVFNLVDNELGFNIFNTV